MKVIFHADDFGLTHGVNQGILKALGAGLLGSASLLAPGEAFSEAARLSNENHSLDLGIHLTLTDERPLTGASALTRLGGSGPMLPSRFALTKALALKRLDLGAAEREWRAQVERILSAGLIPTHLDGHQHVHLLPGLFGLCQRLAAEYNIPYIRARVLDPSGLGAGPSRLFQLWMMKGWGLAYVRPRIQPGIQVVPSLGFLHSGGRLKSGPLLNLLKRFSHLPVLEVITHPGLGDMRTKTKYAPWGYFWEKDLELLLNPGLSENLKNQGFFPASFKDLCP